MRRTTTPTSATRPGLGSGSSPRRTRTTSCRSPPMGGKLRYGQSVAVLPGHALESGPILEPKPEVTSNRHQIVHHSQPQVSICERLLHPDSHDQHVAQSVPVRVNSLTCTLFSLATKPPHMLMLCLRSQVKESRVVASGQISRRSRSGSLLPTKRTHIRAVNSNDWFDL